MKKQKTTHSPIEHLAKQAHLAFPASQRNCAPPLHTPPTFTPLKRPRTQLDQ
jgi:hypothetical protein